MARNGALQRWIKLCILHYLLCFTSAKSPPIKIDGNHFFYPNGSQFFLRGIAYQDGGARAVRSNTAKPIIDPLSNAGKCTRDIPHLLKLGINVIRVYALNASADHSACMQSFDDAGIYVLANLGDGIDDIFRTQTPTWTYALQDRFMNLVDTFQEYSNVLGFIVASEVVTDKNRTAALPFVKAAVRDVKAYIQTKEYRSIPVGFTGSEDEKVQQTPQYLVCSDVWNRPLIDFYGFTLFSWCGKSNMEASGYQRQIQNFQSYPKPVIISEYGCTKPSPRRFTEVSAIYGDKGMTDVFSGAIAYQYFNDSYGFGLVNFKGDTVDETPEFSSLSAQLATNIPLSTSIGDWPATTKHDIPCPTQDSNWFAGARFPPIPSKGICACMLRSLRCIRSSDLSEEASVDALELMCSDGEPKPECLGSSANGTTDKYGAYSICSPTERHSWVLNQLFLSRLTNGSKPEDICTALHGTIQKPEANESALDACEVVIRQAGPEGTGTITSTPLNLPTATQLKQAEAFVPQPKPALSKGAKAGIIAAVVLGVLICIAVGVRIFTQRKKKKSASQPSPINNPISELDTRKAPSPHMLDGVTRHEADGKNVFNAELPGDSEADIAELSPDYEIVELPGDTEYNIEKRNVRSLHSTKGS